MITEIEYRNALSIIREYRKQNKTLIKDWLVELDEKGIKIKNGRLRNMLSEFVHRNYEEYKYVEDLNKEAFKKFRAIGKVAMLEYFHLCKKTHIKIKFPA